MVLTLVDIFCGFIFFPLIVFCATIIKKTKTILWVIMVGNTQNSRISLRWISGQTLWWVVAYSPPALVWFSRGLTLSTLAAALSGMFHTPLFSQQEKPQAAEISFWRWERESWCESRMEGKMKAERGVLLFSAVVFAPVLGFTTAAVARSSGRLARMEGSIGASGYVSRCPVYVSCPLPYTTLDPLPSYIQRSKRLRGPRLPGWVKVMLNHRMGSECQCV